MRDVYSELDFCSERTIEHDFCNMKVKDLFSDMRVRTGAFVLPSMLFDLYCGRMLSDEVWTLFCDQGLPSYAHRVVEIWIENHFDDHERQLFELAYGQEFSPIKDVWDSIGEVLPRSLEQNREALNEAKWGLAHSLNNDEDLLHMKLFRVGKPYAISDLLRAASFWSMGINWLIKKAGRSDIEAVAGPPERLKEFKDDIFALLVEEVPNEKQREYIKYRLFSECDNLWADDYGFIFSVDDRYWESGRRDWTAFGISDALSRGTARRILWQLSQKYQDVYYYIKE